MHILIDGWPIVLMAVKHPNIISVKEFLIPDGDQNEYLVTEHAPEGDLFKHIVKRQKLSEYECRRVFTQLFNAIKYLVCYLLHPRPYRRILTKMP